MSDTWREWEGQVVDGAFQLRRHLGGSDHSVVFLTERGESKQKAAIKFVQAGAAGADAQLSRWKQVAQLSHPNLIKLFETGRCQLAGMDLLYVVMEYAEENLAQFLPQRALAPAETREMLEPFLDTLKYLHAQGLVHGRIKPGNILAIDDQLKLSSDTICRVGESRGSVEKPDAYAPPEAATQKISPADDVWSLGITLVEALTQHVPVLQEPASQPAQQEEPALPDTLPEPFLDITRHCLRRDPQRRWTVADIANRLNPSAVPPPPDIPAATIPVAATPAPTAAAPTAPASTVDPLSVPLSTVTPLPATRKHALQNQSVARPTPYGHSIPKTSSPARSYYIFFGVLLALTLGAMLAIPRLRNRGSQTDPASSTAPSQPVAQPQTRPLTPTKIAPPAPSKPQPKSPPKPAAAPSDQPLQRSALQPTQKSQQDSLQATTEKQPVKKDPSSTDAAPASLRSAVPRSDPAPNAPFATNREASIVAGAITPGEVLNQVLPEVSQKSRNTIHGTLKIVVKVHVDSSGSIAAAEVVSGPSRFFSEAALQAARRWDFAPAKVNGHAVPSEWLLHFDFTQAKTNVTPLPTKP
jgi:TonB family protein